MKTKREQVSGEHWLQENGRKCNMEKEVRTERRKEGRKEGRRQCSSEIRQKSGIRPDTGQVGA